MLQNYCRMLGVRALDQELADLAATLGHVPHRHPLAYLINQAKDFRSPAALADALLNPKHTYTDIFMPVDASEKRLLNAIDRSRSIREIVQADDKDNVGEFFRRLWHYDQTVFDASSR